MVVISHHSCSLSTAIHHNPEPTQIYRFLRARHALKVSEMCLAISSMMTSSIFFLPPSPPPALYLSSSPCSYTETSPTSITVPPGEQGSLLCIVFVFSINNISSMKDGTTAVSMKKNPTYYYQWQLLLSRRYNHRCSGRDQA